MSNHGTSSLGYVQPVCSRSYETHTFVDFLPSSYASDSLLVCLTDTPTLNVLLTQSCMNGSRRAHTRMLFISGIIIFRTSIELFFTKTTKSFPLYEIFSDATILFFLISGKPVCLSVSSIKTGLIATLKTPRYFNLQKTKIQFLEIKQLHFVFRGGVFIVTVLLSLKPVVFISLSKSSIMHSLLLQLMPCLVSLC